MGPVAGPAGKGSGMGYSAATHRERSAKQVDCQSPGLFLVLGV